ncbi:MAG: DUF4384 domain-containing protein [Deltaproteobacteria bacterium]|jgi:hypothetical protein|nr:DUF4384 domain-containing protein [Deltaproteobacteria bacterium]
MRKVFVSLVIIWLFLLINVDLGIAQGRLNFMLTNLSSGDITEVYIAPSYYPDYVSENLIQNTTLDQQTMVYIGPNYYGDQSLWNITVVWANGFKNTFMRCRLTRYNSYVVWDNYAGVHMRQGYERAYARYGQGPPPTMFGGGNPGIQVSVGIPEKVNLANNNYQRPQSQLLQQNKNQKRNNDGNLNKNQQQNEDQYYAQNDQPTKRTTRDLVFDDEDEEEDAQRPVVEGTTAANASGEKIAVKATVELNREGQTKTVLPNELFKSGDRVKLIFSASRPGYVYWLSKGTSGEYQVLYPNSKAGQDNSVEKNKEYTIPAKGAWRFDDNKGTETIVCMLGPERISTLDEAIKLADRGDKTGSSKLVARLVDGHEKKRRTTRDLVFEEEDEEDVNTKTQVTAEGDPFVATYELEHQ